MAQSLASLAPLRHNALGTDPVYARRSLRSRQRITRDTRNALSPLARPSATSPIPSALNEINLEPIDAKTL